MDEYALEALFLCKMPIAGTFVASIASPPSPMVASRPSTYSKLCLNDFPNTIHRIVASDELVAVHYHSQANLEDPRCSRRAAGTS